MKALILGNGSLSDYDTIRRKTAGCDLLICADGGLRHAEHMGLVPDILLGDMDSVSEIPAKIETHTFPVRKDATDGELAVDYALDQGADEIILAGFSGCRLDHTLTNISFLEKIADAGKTGIFLDDTNEIYWLQKENTLAGKPGDLVSIVPLTNLEGVTTTGLDYPLYDETLYFGKSRGVSNVMTGDTCTVTVRAGKGLLIKSRDFI